MALQLNTTVADPSLRDLLDLVKREVFLEFNCHHIATVESFNSAAQTVVATINYTKTVFELNPLTNAYQATQVNYPTVIDCPVLFLGGGPACLTFPKAQGDQCLLLFNDRDMDNWFSGSATGPVASGRLHSFSDAIAVVGLYPKDSPIASFDTSRASLRHGQTMVGVGASLVKIANATTTLNTLLQSLVTQCENLATACAAITVSGVTSGGGVSGVPVNAATLAAVSTALTTLGTQIGGLLE